MIIVQKPYLEVEPLAVGGGIDVGVQDQIILVGTDLKGTQTIMLQTESRLILLL